MKKADKHAIDLNEIAEKDTRCTELEDALLTKENEGNVKPKQWTTQFQASGGKPGQKIVCE